MAEPKPIASLSSGLLARKGMAQPAMRRPMLGFGCTQAVAVQQDDLGWNDMGFDVEPVPIAMEEGPVEIGLTPMAPAMPIAASVPQVVTQREELAERMTGAVSDRKTAAAKGRKAAFTLRLDVNRHLRLRLACAVTGRSAQQIVIQALDECLHNLPEIDRLTQQLPHMRGDQ